MFSTTYKPTKPVFGSNWFQFRLAEVCLSQSRSLRSV
jgi:hypothetical protein